MNDSGQEVGNCWEELTQKLGNGCADNFTIAAAGKNEP